MENRHSLTFRREGLGYRLIACSRGASNLRTCPQVGDFVFGQGFAFLRIRSQFEIIVEEQEENVA